MATDALLFAEQATTSLYERVGDPTDRRVLPLSQAKAAYCALDGATRADPKAARTQQAPEIVVQVRKRNGKTQLLINGYVSTGETEAGGKATRHELLSHTGLHEDVETRTRVFSPIAVVAAVEDGQHPFQRVAVAVVHNHANYETALEPSTVLSEAVVRDHRVDDARCSVVRVPYPLAYPNPPTVIVYDDAQIRRFQLVQKSKEQYGYALKTATYVFNVWNTWRAKDVDGSTLQQFGALSGLATLRTLAGAVGLALQGAGWPLAGFLLLAAIPVSSDAAGKLVNGDLGDDYLKLVEPINQAATEAVQKYINMPVDPAVRKTKFTLPQLAMAIEAIAVRRTPDADKPPEAISDKDAQQTTSYKREAVVWYWLSGQGGDANAADFTNLVATAEHMARLHLRITVDDSLSCEAGSHTHNVHCPREDGPLLGAAAAGTIDDLLRLHGAIQSLKGVLKDAIDGKAPPLFDLWIDRSWYNPMRYVAALGSELADEAKSLSNAAASVTGSIVAMRTAGMRNRAKKAYIKGWTNASGIESLTSDRLGLLKTVRDNLEKRLTVPLFGSGTAGAKLYTQMQTALDDQRIIVATAPPAVWERRLPQRAVSNYGGYLFSAVRDTGNAYVDVDTGGALSRMHDEYHDASSVLSACMKSSRLALKRLVPEWEASSDTRIQLRCVCASINSSTPRFVDAVSYATLALSTPVDIRLAGVLASPTEHSQRRIRMVVRRAAREGEGEPPSVLEALKLEHSDPSLLACQVFGDLWADELVALYRTSTHKQTEMLEMASVRAAVRLRAAGELLLQLVASRRPGDDAGEFSDVALTGTDVALVATQPGRDAARLVGRVLFSQTYLAVRSVLTSELRDAARAAVRASAVFERAPPTTLPHEACASLFGDRLNGLAAFLRAQDLSSDRVVLEAMMAAYPSARLLALDADNRDAHVRRARDLAPVPPQRAVALTSPALVRAMRFRLASLRINAPSLDAAVASPQSITADQLATRLAATSLGSADHPSFYVPFGFGDARPPPTLPPCAAPLFGTVPVYGSALAGAYRSIAAALEQEPQANVKPALSVRLEPAFDCIKLPASDPGGEETESIHPNVIQVLWEGNDVVVRYTASRMPALHERTPAPARAQYAVGSVAEAAGAHVHSAEASQLALVVSSVAWNAERVVQAVVAALASGDDEAEYGAVDVTLVLPPTDTRVSHWYTRPPNPMAVAQEAHRRGQRMQMRDIILKGNLAMQQSLMAKALAIARAIDRFGSGHLKTPEREPLVAKITSSDPLDLNPANDFKMREETFIKLFDEDLLGALEKELQSSTTYATLPTAAVASKQSPEDLVLEEMRSLKAAIVAAEGMQVLGAPEPPVLRDAAPAPASRAVSEQTVPLLAALGVGMAMLTPQLERVPVRCVAVRAGQPLAMDLPQRATALADTFSNCSAMRLSEACLVASRQA